MPHCNHLIVIAGKHPPSWMMRESSRYKNVRLIPDPDQAKLDTLVRDAQVHILPAMQTSGVKLKLVNALFSGRHLLCNAEMVAGTGLDPFCHLAESGKYFLEKAELLMQEPFTASHILERKKLET
ncbi:MAG: glycosyltransferase family 1 protein, partial [bacterium]